MKLFIVVVSLFHVVKSQGKYLCIYIYMKGVSLLVMKAWLIVV